MWARSLVRDTTASRLHVGAVYDQGLPSNDPAVTAISLEAHTAPPRFALAREITTDDVPEIEQRHERVRTSRSLGGCRKTLHP